MPSIAETVDAASITRVHPLHQAIQIDPDASAPVYVGWALPGSLTSAPVWRICKLTYSGANITAVLWSVHPNGGTRGDALYTKVWDDRATLTYN